MLYASYLCFRASSALNDAIVFVHLPGQHALPFKKTQVKVFLTPPGKNGYSLTCGSTFSFSALFHFIVHMSYFISRL